MKRPFSVILLVLSCLSLANAVNSTDYNNLSPENKTKVDVLLFLKCLEVNELADKVQVLNNLNHGISIAFDENAFTDIVKNNMTGEQIMVYCKNLYLNRTVLSVDVGDYDLREGAFSYGYLGDGAADVVYGMNITSGTEPPSQEAPGQQLEKRYKYKTWYDFFVSEDSQCVHNEMFQTIQIYAKIAP